VPTCAAEAELENFKRTPSAAITVLHLLTSDGLPAHVRQAGAVYFKNMCKQHWDAEASDITIAEPVKQQVRTCHGPARANPAVATRDGALSSFGVTCPASLR